MDPYHHLWLSVLQTAFNDLEHEPFNSYWHNEAMSFFFASGPWAASRQALCDMIDCHPHDLHRPALRVINRRRLEQGLPPMSPRTPQPASGPRLPTTSGIAPAEDRKPVVWPRLVATFNEPDRPRRRGGIPGKTWAYNPFNPFRPLPSEHNQAAGGEAD
jgi:hypothetical protein